MKILWKAQQVLLILLVLQSTKYLLPMLTGLKIFGPATLLITIKLWNWRPLFTYNMLPLLTELWNQTKPILKKVNLVAQFEESFNLFEIAFVSIREGLLLSCIYADLGAVRDSLFLTNYLFVTIIYDHRRIKLTRFKLFIHILWLKIFHSILHFKLSYIK